MKHISVFLQNFYSVKISFLLRDGFFYFTYEYWPFNTWCSLKGHAMKSYVFKQSCSWKLQVCFKYIWLFSGHQALKGNTFLSVYKYVYLLKGTHNSSKIRLWEKRGSSTEKNVYQNTNEHTCDYLRHVSLLICLCWSFVWFWGVIRKNTS